MNKLLGGIKYFFDKEKLIVLIGIAINILSSVLIVQVNKYVYVNYGFPNMTMTCIHFIVTFLGLCCCNQLKIFEIKKVPILKMVPMSITFCGFVVLTNLSLEFNSVGTYQILKALTTPVVMFISAIFYSKTYSKKVKIAVGPVLVGVFLNSAYDINFDPVGITLGLLGVLITSLYQVWVGTKQKDFKLNALQLLFYQAPLSAFILFLVVPFFEPLLGRNGVFDSTRTLDEWFFVLLSAIIAFVVNLSIYWIIGATSVLTYNMIGHLKFVLIVACGFFIFDERLNLKQMLGVVVTLSGLIAYSYFSIKETEEKKALELTQKSNLDVETGKNNENK